MTVIHAPGCEHLRLETCIRQSALKRLAESSPRHVQAEYYSGTTPESSEAQAKGTLLHTLVLEPGEYASRHRVRPNAARNTLDGCKALIEWYAEQLEEFMLPVPPLTGTGVKPMQAWFDLAHAALSKEVTVTTQADLDDAQRMHAAVWSLEDAVAVLSHPGLQTEVTILWIDADTGAHCRATLDMFIAPCREWPQGLIVDLKTSRTAHPVGFGYQLEQLKYHWQADFYRRAFHAMFDHWPPYKWLVVENSGPVFGACLYECSEEYYPCARAEYEPLLTTLSDALTSGKWPGYPVPVVPLSPSRRMILRHERGE